MLWFGVQQNNPKSVLVANSRLFPPWSPPSLPAPTKLLCDVSLSLSYVSLSLCYVSSSVCHHVTGPKKKGFSLSSRILSSFWNLKRGSSWMMDENELTDKLVRVLREQGWLPKGTKINRLRVGNTILGAWLWGGYVGSRDLAGSVAPFSQCDLHFPVGWLSLFTTLELYLWELEKYINMHKAYKARKSDESTTAQPHVYHNIHAVK
ncbi:uncharacterized protein YALI1_E19488g [Yarrowia lipolytica]|uniref:Uncharacterized protein n=1 Tax=Yarrowia lipolytica TaxID=4952 RepID=A0A1D8NIM6_YARLL|nr:hypothetical protein YALI1_E19488g [Yarrowia lipolytica]